MIRRAIGALGRNARHLRRDPIGSRKSAGDGFLGPSAPKIQIQSCLHAPGSGFRFFAKAPVSVEEFQHEEITGPTVERDVSATANELRESIDSLLQAHTKLKRALIAVGAMQLVAGWWIIGSHYRAETLFLVFMALSAGLSLHLAYHLHTTMKHVPFFQRVEERSRMRVLTLSMQTIKAATQMLGRSNVIARFTAIGLIAACVYEGVQIVKPPAQEP